MTTAVLPPPVAPPAPGSAPKRMTIEEFLALHEGDNVELVHGLVKELPVVAGLNHGSLCMRIGVPLYLHAETNKLGRVMSNDSFVKTDPETLRGADVLFYSYERLPREQAVPETFHTLPPDLVVEVKSPNDTWTDLLAKMLEYLRCGVRVVVLVDPNRSTVSVYRGDDQEVFRLDDALTLPDVLPGFSLPVRQIFE